MAKLWSVLFALVNLAALGLFAVAMAVPRLGWWLPRDVSTYGYQVDYLYYLILYVTGFFFVLTEAILVYCMWKYAAKPEAKALYTHGNFQLEWLWTIVPTFLLLFLAFAQIRAWENVKYQSRFPEPTQYLEVSARQFEWRIRYPNSGQLRGLTSAGKEGEKQARHWGNEARPDDVRVVNDLHTWKGAKVLVYLKTRDVLHSFFLPNLRLKQDAIPGKTIPVWFETTESNVEYDPEVKKWLVIKGREWPLACAELCGWGHYKMQGQLLVHPTKQDYDRWLAEAEKEQKRRTPEQLAEK